MKVKRKEPRWIYTILGLAVLSVIVLVLFANMPNLSPMQVGRDVSNPIIAIFTALTVLFLFMSWREARHEREDAERPHISIMLRLHPDTNRVLVISNTGKSIALNTRLRLRHVKEGLEVETPFSEHHEKMKLRENPLFTHKSDVPVGWLYEFLLPDGKEYREDEEEKFHPRMFSIDISFESLTGTEYSYNAPVDVNAHKHSIVPSRSTAQRLEVISSELLPVIKKIASELESIKRAMKDS